MDNVVRTSIIEGICRPSNDDHVILHRQPPSKTVENQFLFFAKPELLSADSEDYLEKRFSFILNKMSMYDFVVESVLLLSGNFLRQYNIIAEHYGVIDRIARNPLESLAQSGRSRFNEIFGRNLESVSAVGALEYVRNRSDITTAELSDQWLERGYEKLAGGSYCQYLENEDLYLFNGFYPYLHEHFTNDGARIAVFVVSGNTAWSIARNDFIGVTDPSKAERESIRNDLYRNKTEYGLEVVSPNLNGVHLSAGPVEGLVELLRFTDDRKGSKKNVGDFPFGSLLRSTFIESEIERILANVDVEVASERVSIFDLTEELDSSVALKKLVQVRGSLGAGAP